MLNQPPLSMSDRAAEEADLRLRILALTAIVAALPGVANVDVERVRAIIGASLETGTGPDMTKVARAMHFAQETLNVARS